MRASLSEPPRPADATRAWRAFWDGSHAIYVNDRHREAHYRRIADDVLRELPPGRPVVLDHGCGEALDAGRIAQRCTRLYLLDSAPSVVGRLQARFAGDSRIVAGPSEALAEIPAASLDLVIMNSVAQYLSPAELESWLKQVRPKLCHGGRILLADILPPEDGMLADALALLRTAWREGFLGAALAGLVRTTVSDYRRLRRSLGLTRYAETEMLRLLAELGFAAIRRQHNLGFNQRRMMFEARADPNATG